MSMTAQAVEARAAEARPGPAPDPEPRRWPPCGPAQGLDFDQMVRWRPRGEPDLYPDPPQKPPQLDRPL
ncbi:MAG: hypothetical protein KIT25_00040 [Enhydrobacter sp.]|nr:MAG: hypothetical protein KIT25_00040 [Enhydrobacter sp.]